MNVAFSSYKIKMAKHSTEETTYKATQMFLYKTLLTYSSCHILEELRVSTERFLCYMHFLFPYEEYLMTLTLEIDLYLKAILWISYIEFYNTMLT